MNYSQLKNAIAEVIRTNGNEEITGEVLQYTLLEMVSVLGKDYQFAGVGTPLTDTTERDDNVAWILGRGTYENFGNPFTVAVDEIAVVKYDGTFTVEKIKTGVVVDSELTLEGTNPVEGGAIAREFAKMRAAGYFFTGIMTPTGTPPHDITEKIFYLCTQAGVYPNFDSIVLDRGLNILKWNGSRWSADLVFAITDDVTEGLASLLTSAGAYAAIAAEAQLRQEGDAAVQQNIDNVEALIPSQASVDNKLVDEQKMNSSIATATATYRGAYNQVSNLNLGVDATHEQVALALASQITYLHITPDNNDYCYVLVPTSAETPTEIAHIDRYKYNGTAWGYEYTLNNSGYTAAQWAAINSGITSGLVAKLGALPTAEELAAALLAKQDVLTFDNAPTHSSTNPVTSGGVYTAIDDEKGARVNADAALQQSIEAILLLIPSAATALNQLADKAFVNSSIATATATFRGTFNLVSDLQLTVDATHADIAAALLNAISGADNNDYAFVQIPTSVDTPTEIRVTERYKFNGTVWLYEYDLNNSGFTAAQWAAINSGITALLVTKLSNLPNATELAALFSGKQNVLTFDNAPVNGSDNPVKSGGLYDLFAAIDAKMPTGASANNKLVAEDRLAAYVGGIIGALDATFDLTSTDGHVTLRMTQTDGIIASVQILTSDIASASALATLGGQVSTNADDIAALQALYNALQQSAPEIIQPTDTWPVANPSDTVIYRVIDRVNTPPQYYSDYMWNGTTMVLMATYNNAIDAVPTAGSHNLVESGGVAAPLDEILSDTLTTDAHDNTAFSNVGFIESNGNIAPNTSFKYTDLIPIDVRTLIRIDACAVFGNEYGGGVAFYDKNENFIGICYNKITILTNEPYTLTIWDVPSNTVYIRVCCDVSGLSINSPYVNIVNVSSSKGRLSYVQQEAFDSKKILDNIYGQTTSVTEKDASYFINDGFFVPSGQIEQQGVSTWTYTDYIAIDLSKLVELDVSATFGNEYGGGIAFYDENYGFISLLYHLNETLLDNTVIQLSRWDIPKGTAYIRVNRVTDGATAAFVKITNQVTATGLIQQLENAVFEHDEEIDALEEKVGNASSLSADVSIASLSTGEYVEVTNVPNIKNYYSIGFSAKINTMGKLTLSHGAQPYAIGKVDIDETNITTYNFNGDNTQVIPHGLTFVDFIDVIITLDSAIDSAKITIITNNGGLFQTDIQWGGASDNVKAECVSGSYENIVLSFGGPAFSKDVWIFSDSYSDFFPQKMESFGYKNYAIDGKSGRGSVEAYTSLIKGLSFGKPKVILWDMGMNDPDTSTAINSNYKVTIDNLVRLCKSKNIHLAVCTIPNTSKEVDSQYDRINVFKNAYIHSLTGIQVVELAKMLNAEALGSSWYNGLLSADEVHPSDAGAAVIARCMALAVPEII